ncbi:MAG: hypothetical protein IJA86_09740 [Clostridia bacterium]|nr:hypothetical protein [Clostridia bacterium]
MERKQISKGIYQHGQIGNFVSVKNYIFIRKDGKKHLMLRFTNECDYLVNFMTYVIVQMDGTGKVIARTKVTHENLNFRPGAMYVTENPIRVDEYCSDFKIVFSEVVSGFYRYEVHTDMITVHYIKVPEPIVDLSEYRKKVQRKYKETPVGEYCVEQKKFQERGVAAFVTAVITAVLLALNILNMYLMYMTARNPSFLSDLPYLGNWPQYINKLISSFSVYLNFLTEGGFPILLCLLIGIIGFGLAIAGAQKRSPKRKKDSVK